MKINRKIKGIFIVSVFGLIVLLASSPKSYAVTLEASGLNNPYTANASTMFDAIRDMETGTLGLSTKGSTSDGIDCHMCKSTEYGTAELLMISVYGIGTSKTVGTSAGASTSSTGNASGVYQLAGNWEWVAGYYANPKTSSNFESLFKADGKYVDVYYTTSIPDTSEHPGDALFAYGFLGSTAANWVNADSPVFERGYGGSGLFSYYRNTGAVSYAGRAVVVCGADL